MQLHAILFFSAQAAASGYALIRGGTPERLVAAGLGLAAVATWAIPVHPATSFRNVEWTRLSIDVLLLGGLIGIALFANRYWPMLMAAVQLDTVALHGVRAYDSFVQPLVFASLLGWAAYPILIILVVGTLRHRARETRAGRREDAWS